MALKIKMTLTSKGIAEKSLTIQTVGLSGEACLAITAEMRERMGIGFDPTGELYAEAPNDPEIFVEA